MAESRSYFVDQAGVLGQLSLGCVGCSRRLPVDVGLDDGFGVDVVCLHCGESHLVHVVVVAVPPPAVRTVQASPLQWEAEPSVSVGVARPEDKE